MGLDWYATVDLSTSRMQLPETNHEQPPTFRGHEIISSEFPDDIVGPAWTDKHPVSMLEFSNALAAELHANRDMYGDETIAVVENAIAWLDYWAGERYCLQTEW